MIKLQKRKDELKIKLPKSMRGLIIFGTPDIDEDFGLSVESKPKIIKGDNHEN